MTGPIVHPVRCDPRHSWLPVLLPATARRLSVPNVAFRTTLADAGAEFVADGADLEIAAARHVQGAAPHALVPLGRAGEPALEGWPRFIRGARRGATFAVVWTASTATAMRLRRRGFESARVFTWDVERPVGGGRFPLGAVVAADRDEPAVSVLEAIRAKVDSGELVTLPRIGSWGVVCPARDTVLRVSVGPGRHLLDTQARAFDFLAGRADHRRIQHLVPWLLAEGKTGLAAWSLERRLPGSPLSEVLPDAVLAECIDLLALLHGLSEQQSAPGALVDAAAVVAPFSGELEPRLRRLAEQLESTLAEVPSTFAHGDVSPANVLVLDGRLSGLVDWNKAGGGRAPLHDLLNLRLAIEQQRTRSSFGTGFANWLLPLMHAGGDEPIRSYCARVGVSRSPQLLVALATAYWLDRVADQIRTYADREQRHGWLRENVVRPAAAVLAR